MKITQDSYGKIVEKKISLEMERLKGLQMSKPSKKLGGFFMPKIYYK